MVVEARGQNFEPKRMINLRLMELETAKKANLPRHLSYRV
jgi:hypothetical protein